MRLELTKRGDYGIRAILALARAPRETLLSVRRIAEEMAIPRQFLPQVMADLGRARLVEAVPGRAGGYRIARSPAEITILDIVEAVEGDNRRRSCVLRGGPCSPDGACDVHRVFAAAQDAILGTLSAATVADLPVRRGGMLGRAANEVGAGSTGRHAAFPTFPELATPRLILRELTADDTGWYLAHFSRPEIVTGQGFPPPADLGAARAELGTYVLDLFERRAGFRWGIRLREAPALVGSVGFYRWLDEPRPQAEVGYDLDPEWWGRGLMSEALRAVLDFGFGRMGLQRIEALVLTGNDRSIRLLERLGFAREALLPSHGADEHGELRDELRFALERPPELDRPTARPGRSLPPRRAGS